MLTLRRYRESERGFTLVELIVTIGILGIVGVIVLTSTVRALRATAEANERTNALTDIERGLERVSRQIRVADPLVIDPDGACDVSGVTVAECEDILERRLDAVTFFGGERNEFAFFLVDTGTTVELRQDVETYDFTTGTLLDDQDNQFIADIANLDTGEPLFRFFGDDEVSGELIEISCTDPSDPAADVDVCRNRYGTASSVQITLQKTLSNGDPLSVETAVNIRNTRYAQ